MTRLTSHAHWHDPDDEERPGVTVQELTAADLPAYLALLQDEQAAASPPARSATRADATRPQDGRRSPPGRPGASAYAAYLHRRAAERRVWLATWPRQLVLVGLVAAASTLLGVALGGPAWMLTLPATLWAAWVQRFRPSADTLAWKKGSTGERATGRVLRRLERRGWVVLHDLRVPGSQANIDHLVIGPAGVFVIDSKNYRGYVWVDAAGTLWRGSYCLQRVVETVWWQTRTVAEHLMIPATCSVRPLLCVHGVPLPRGGLCTNDLPIVSGRDLVVTLQTHPEVFDAAQVAAVAATARARLQPATAGYDQAVHTGG